MKLGLRLFGWLVAVAIAGYFVWFLTETFRTQDLSALTSAPVFGATLLTALLYCLIIPISGAAWSLLLSRQGESWSPARLAAIMGVTQMGKYIPGNIAQIAGRASLSLREGMKLRTFTLSVVHETILTAAASAIVGLGLYLLSPTSLMHLPGADLWIVMGAAGAAACAVIVLAFGRSLLPVRIRAHDRIAPLLNAIGPSPRPAAIAAAFAAYGANYLLIGIGIWCIGLALGITTPRSYALVTGAFALAWVLGYITPGAPAGVGVREGMLALLLQHAVPAHQLLTLIVSARLATMMGDGICFCVGLWGMRATVSMRQT
jgi:hypothetical protein